jgi:hypothetical protein
MPNSRNGGWLPIEISVDRQPTVISGTTVRWMEFGTTPLAEPFLYHTVTRLREVNPPARELETDLEAVLRVGGQHAIIPPLGFIFHISRCGSTLIANALKLSRGTRVVSEARPITQLFLPYSDPGPYLADRRTQMRRMLLNSLFSIFANYNSTDVKPLIIKFMSINTLCMSTIRSFWPQVPCIVVIRDPVEVIVGNLTGGGLMSYKTDPAMACEMFRWQCSRTHVENMANEEFCAKVVGRYLEAALNERGENCRVVDYEDINAAKIHDIAAFFKIEFSPQLNILDKVLGNYAKDPTASRQFEDDRARKQRSATSRVRDAAKRWAIPAYTSLRTEPA